MTLSQDITCSADSAGTKRVDMHIQQERILKIELMLCEKKIDLDRLEESQNDESGSNGL